MLAEDADAKVWNLDIVKPGTPLPLVPGKYHSPLCDGESLGSTFVECDVRKPIGGLPFTPTPGDIIFNFAVVHRTPGSPDYDYFETNILGAENVPAFAEKYEIKRIVFTSSIAPYSEKHNFCRNSGEGKPTDVRRFAFIASGDLKCIPGIHIILFTRKISH